jgi:hypothetical protein
MRLQLKNIATKLNEEINHAINFVVDVFGENQELVALMINLLYSYHFVLFITQYPSETFLKYNETLLIDRKNKQLLLEIESIEKKTNEAI